MQRVSLILVFLLSFTAITFGATFRDTENLAKDGDIGAQVRLGDMYYAGDGVKKNDKLAVKWFRLAADKNYSEALYKLGFMYENGFGVTKNIDAAMDFYNKAAGQGHNEAQFALGNIWLQREDLEQAKRWFDQARASSHLIASSKSSEIESQNLKDPYHKESDYLITMAQGNPEAMYKLGEKYQEARVRAGDAVPDYDTAMYWYTAASNRGYLPALMRIANIYEAGELLIARDYKKAFSWYEKAAKANSIPAQLKTAAMYKAGQGVAKNLQMAASWYQRAAAQGSPEAAFNLGVMFENGAGVGRNYQTAFNWYKTASDKGHPKAKFNLGHLYQIGLGVPQSYAEAFRYYKEAADYGDITAQYEVGKIYKEGLHGVERNDIQAVKYLSLAADRGHIAAKAEWDYMFMENRIFSGKSVDGISFSPQTSYRSSVSAKTAEEFAPFEESAAGGDIRSQFELSKMYQKGIGGAPQSNKEAFKWLLRAASNGYGPAQLELANVYQKAAEVNDKRRDEYNRQSVKWFRASGAQGGLQAQFSVGKIYERGLPGVARNVKEAMFWYQKAALQTGPLAVEAQLALSALAENQYVIDGVDPERQPVSVQPPKLKLKTPTAAKPSPKQSVKATPKLTAKPEPKPAIKAETDGIKNRAENGDHNAQYEMGLRFYNPHSRDNSSNDYKEAFDWFNKSARQGNDRAQYALGVMYYRGHGVKAEPKRAFELFLEAANKGNSNAQNSIYSIYAKGDKSLGIEPNPKEAAKWEKVEVSLQKVDNLDGKGKIKALEIIKNVSSGQ
jgi:TPR repeat protein